MNTKSNSYSNPQLVVIALGQLGGQGEFIDVEDIALRANEVAPGRFNWRKYPQYIDLSIVANALRDARKSRYGNFAVSDGKGHWSLTPAGIEFIKSADPSKLAAANPNKGRNPAISEQIHIETERLKKTRAYRLYKENLIEQISQQDFFEFAKLNEYFQSRARQRRYSIIESAVSADRSLADLWGHLKLKFVRELA